RLAHIDRTGPSAAERLAARLLRDRGGRLVLHKDAALARRRYPIPYFLGMTGLVALWIAAAAAPGDLLFWAGAISAGLGVYGAIVARRSVVPPIEHPAFLRTLPLSERAV